MRKTKGLKFILIKLVWLPTFPLYVILSHCIWYKMNGNTNWWKTIKLSWSEYWSYL